MLSFFKKKEETVKELKACLSGTVIPIEEVEDEMFASKTLGDGVGIRPGSNIVTAPCDGVISVVMQSSKHAVGMTLNNGAEILIHVGLDTVNMEGEGFTLFVKEGDKVKAGEKLLQFEPELIISKGYKTTTVIVVTNTDEFPDAKYISGMEARQNETEIMVF